MNKASIFLLAADLVAATPSVAKAKIILTRDVLKGCEVASTSMAYMMGSKDVIPALKAQADLCIAITQDLISKGAENGICPQKLPVANMLAAGSVMFYLLDHPGEGKRPIMEVAKKALQSKFPCK